MNKIIALAALAVVLAACPHPIPGQPGPVAHIVDCGREAVTGQGIALIPAVNSCLVQITNPIGCVLALADPAAHITVDFLGCLVRGRGAEFAAAARANPDDQLSKLAADNAARFLSEQRIMFSD